MRSVRIVPMLLLANCAVEATRPLTPLSSAKADPALVGTWISIGKDNTRFVVTAKQGALVAVEVVRADRIEEKEPLHFEGHVSVLAPDLKILNLRALDGGKQKGAFVLVRYAVQADGTLATWVLNERLFKEALNAGTLKGHVGPYVGVTLEDPPEKIVAFIMKAKREDLFEPLLTLKRDTP